MCACVCFKLEDEREGKPTCLHSVLANPNVFEKGRQTADFSGLSLCSEAGSLAELACFDSRCNNATWRSPGAMAASKQHRLGADGWFCWPHSLSLSLCLLLSLSQIAVVEVEGGRVGGRGGRNWTDGEEREG